MGVKGLLPILQSITSTTSLDQYKGLSVAVDAMSWLHKGLFSADVRTIAIMQQNQIKKEDNYCAFENLEVARKIDFEACSKAENFATSNNEDEMKAIKKCASYVIHRAKTLKNDYNMDIILVIDGANLPIKEKENERRRSDRLEAFKLAQKAEDKADTKQARKFYGRACAITYEIKYELIQECRLNNISFLVAPYEADAQMARLAHTGIVDLVITEDSDLLAYGCPRILFKIDFKQKSGQEIQIIRDLALNESLPFRNWTHDMFVYMCLVSGCDYCEGIRGLGVKGAHKLVRIHRSPSKIFSALIKLSKFKTDEEASEFRDSFWEAYRTFRHQRIYCVEKERIETLFPLDELYQPSDEDRNFWPYLGSYIEPKIAKDIASGVLHPLNKTRWDQIYPPTKLRKEVLPSNSSDSNKENLNAKDALCNDNNLFSFFSSKKQRETIQQELNEASKPPLLEIYVDNSSENTKSKQKHETKKTVSCDLVPFVKGPKVPIHFKDYNSNFVAENFQTLSRSKNLKKIDKSFNITRIARKVVRGVKATLGTKIQHESKVDHSQKLSSCPDNSILRTRNESRPRCRPSSSSSVNNPAKLSKTINPNHFHIKHISENFPQEPMQTENHCERNMKIDKIQKNLQIHRNCYDFYHTSNEETQNFTCDKFSLSKEMRASLKQIDIAQGKDDTLNNEELLSSFHVTSDVRNNHKATLQKYDFKEKMPYSKRDSVNDTPYLCSSETRMIAVPNVDISVDARIPIRNFTDRDVKSNSWVGLECGASYASNLNPKLDQIENEITETCLSSKQNFNDRYNEKVFDQVRYNCDFKNHIYEDDCGYQLEENQRTDVGFNDFFNRKGMESSMKNFSYEDKDAKKENYYKTYFKSQNCRQSCNIHSDIEQFFPFKVEMSSQRLLKDINLVDGQASCQQFSESVQFCCTKEGKDIYRSKRKVRYLVGLTPAKRSKSKDAEEQVCWETMITRQIYTTCGGNG